MHQFLAKAHGMTAIERWNNKPNLLPETVAAHSFLVAVMAWGLAADTRSRGGALHIGEVLKRAIAHDLHEVITGDILAPTKRADPGIAKAVAQLEREASLEVLATLPGSVGDAMAPYLLEPTDDTDEGRIVAAADLFAAYFKSWLEVQLGNAFHRATQHRIHTMLAGSPLPAVTALVDDIGGQAEPGPHDDRQSLANFLHHLVALYYVKRWNFLPALAPKSVAAHIHLVTLAAWVIALNENHTYNRQLPIDLILGRALLLEAPKAITGDILYRSKVASEPMLSGVETVRSRAGRQLLDSLPAALRGYFEPSMAPLPGAAGKLVEEAALVAAYMEVLMEVRLGNSYFVPLRQSLEDRLSDPFPTTAQLLVTLGKLGG